MELRDILYFFQSDFHFSGRDTNFYFRRRAALTVDVFRGDLLTDEIDCHLLAPIDLQSTGLALCCLLVKVGAWGRLFNGLIYLVVPVVAGQIAGHMSVQSKGFWVDILAAKNFNLGAGSDWLITRRALVGRLGAGRSDYFR